ncbi:ATP-binding protein [Gemmatimonas sp.]|uniref:ATP-binding protein n=1 Tax=Gemmatimonas sp. TaxID=1962908 RepID=UPI00398392FD
MTSSTLLTAPTRRGESLGALAFVRFGPSAIVAAILYFLAVAAPLAASFRYGSNFGVWPATAVGIFTLFLTPRELRPVMVAALAVMNWCALELFVGGSLPVQLLLISARVVGEWGTTECTERVLRRPPELEQPGDLARFGLIAAFGTIPLAALLGGIGYAVIGRGTVLMEGFQWWVSEITWVLLLVPALMHLRRLQVATTPSTTRQQVLERLLFFEALALSLLVAFSYTSASAFQPPLGVVVSPLLIWSAFRLGVGTTLWGTIAVAGACVLATLNGRGPFVGLSDETFYQIAWAQGYAFVVGSSHILLAVAVGQRRADAEERARILETVRTASARLEAHFAGARDAVAVVDADGTLVAASPTAAHLVAQLEQASAQSWPRVLGGETFTATMRLEPDQEYAVTMLPLRDASDAIIGASASAINLTDLRSAIAAEERSQRLATVGRLAGGIAHDFNNIMMVILGNLTLLKEGMPPNDRKRADVDEASAAAQRAVGLTRQLLAYARRQTIEPQQLDLGAHVRQMASMLERLLGADIALEVDVTTTDSSVWIDPSQLDQVVVNLSVNARDAMPAGGSLRLLVESGTVDDALAAELGMAAGEAISLIVQDDGHGIAPDALPHVFEPFFSTKPIGKGTGLGLATVDGIIRQAGGAISVASSVERGAAFTIRLPKVRGVSPQAATDATASRQPDRQSYAGVA